MLGIRELEENQWQGGESRGASPAAKWSMNSTRGGWDPCLLDPDSCILLL